MAQQATQEGNLDAPQLEGDHDIPQLGLPHSGSQNNQGLQEQLSEASINIQRIQVQDQTNGAVSDSEQEKHTVVQNSNVDLGKLPVGAEVETSKSVDEFRTQEATRLWGSFLSKGNSEDIVIKVPLNWFYFFTSMLLSPDNFGWASELMSSPAMGHITASQDNVQGNVPFVIPKECPVNKRPCFFNNAFNDEEPETPVNSDTGTSLGDVLRESEKAVVPYKKRRAAKRLTPLVDTQVRRSERVLKNSNGFKSSTCLSKKCFCCNPKPPTLSPKIIKNIAVQFCGMEDEEISDEALGQKRKKAQPVARKGQEKGNPDQDEPTGGQARLQAEE